MSCWSRVCYACVFLFFFKQKTAYEMRISDWSSDVCSSDLGMGGMFKYPLLTAFAKSLNDYTKSIDQPGPTQLDIIAAQIDALYVVMGRSEERRVGKECVSTWRSRWTPYH